MSFNYTSRVYDVLCALSDGSDVTAFDTRYVDAALAMIDARGSLESALRYCSCLMV